MNSRRTGPVSPRFVTLWGNMDIALGVLKYCSRKSLGIDCKKTDHIFKLKGCQIKII
ncbi:hypothetical protein SAMN02746065_11064 [Desulfocicer vacuolatum DSM 3385]|uniref:Uncharacterized protein n=1 Tax=Desulfocicer vacuolatum DSM 3385 TaxID=1121400 RepID=A0A1W2C151_9BACT|nr:hypothetical protein SAMN02746065_11064 [Desulfocicer vacuolatum DSM 3385]